MIHGGESAGRNKSDATFSLRGGGGVDLAAPRKRSEGTLHQQDEIKGDDVIFEMKELTTMLLDCSSAASCIRLVSWLRYLWFSCSRRGAASLSTVTHTVSHPDAAAAAHRRTPGFTCRWARAGT